MNVSAWSIRNPIPAVMGFALLSFLGIMAFKAMKVQMFPDIDLPMITVNATMPGASPDQMETEVARKIENALASSQGLKHLYTQVSEGSAIISAEFRLERNTQGALEDVRSAVTRIRSDLPKEMLDPVINKVELSGKPILTYTVASPSMSEEELSWFVDNNITKLLLGVKGVGAVSRVGGVTRQVRVELDPTKMLALNLTAAEISSQLRQIQQEAPGGRTDLGGMEQSVRTVATVQTAAELAQMEIALRDGRHVRLEQVANVTDGIAERRSAALHDGRPVVGFEIVRSIGAGDVAVAEGVERALETLKRSHPEVGVEKVFNTVDQVVETYQGSMEMIFEGALLAVIVVIFFLRNTRATIVAATALPLAVIPTFAFMYLLGFTVNMVTLLALSLVVGVLVDDAIVEIENIMRHLEMGKTPYQAAMEAADEIGMAVIATTFTLVAVFLPTAFMSGIPGKFFVQFGWTAAIAVMISLVVARLLTPMMSAYILRPRAEHPTPKWLEMYLRWAQWCLNNRVKTLLATVVFFFGSFLLAGTLPTAFQPKDNLSQTQIILTLPPGSKFEQTYALAEEARRIVMQNPDVILVYTAIGGGATGGDAFEPTGAPEARKATLSIQLKPKNERSRRKQEIEDGLREAMAALPGVRVKVGLGASSDKYQVVLTSENGNLLTEHALKVGQELRTIPGVGNVVSNSSVLRPEVVVRPDFAKAADLGVTSSAIAEALRVATNGDYDQSLAKLNLPDRQLPIIVKLRDDARQDLDLLSRLVVQGSHGPVMLGNVATLTLESGPAQIDRFDRQRNITFEVELAGQPLGKVQEAAMALPSLKNLPEGVAIEPIGDAEMMVELFASFGLAMFTGVLCIYIVLVLLFKDFMQPATILWALILSIPGAFLALFVTHTSISMPSMIGIIMLMGIATKNSILLVEYAIVSRRERGMNRTEALLDACKKRARPIVMTTMAMGAGMMPVALDVGMGDGSFRSPMAIVVIGGLITSTFLSLLVIPVVFTYVDDFIVWLRTWVNRLRQIPAGTKTDIKQGA
ncbi:MAG: efflux RND transporter permease subunit [Gammaproteobacteria bacterium]|nr:efflux RND transporter permease subunit [Gammaproteobacteria bacterium]MBU1775449.1 efflux RND transporter permease subunit [Gammaproteobacteria bacterium]MBU1969048.1 efflux RND transporter permease subunit [Gammaproteobacteria bacterium]